MTAARETTVAQHHEHMRKLRKLDDAGLYFFGSPHYTFFTLNNL